MDVGTTNGWRMDDVVPSRKSCGGSARCRSSPRPQLFWRSGRALALPDGSGEIGVISSVTQAFCSTCNRVRLSADGNLYTCLFALSGYDLKALLRGGAPTRRCATRLPRIGKDALTGIPRSGPLRHLH